MAESSKLQSGSEGYPHMPTTSDLIAVSRSLTTDWKMFVREIEVPDSEIDAIIEKHRFDPLEQKYQCLCYWLNDKGDQASFKQLIDAAKKSSQVKLAKGIETISKRGNDDRAESPVNIVDRILSRLRIDSPLTWRKKKFPAKSDDLDGDLAPSEDALTPLPDDSLQPPQPDGLDLTHFWPYQCLRYVQGRLPFLGALIRVFLLFIVILQLLLSMLILTFSVYFSANQHSCISSQKGFFMFQTVFLYFFTRGQLPLITVCVFSNAVISKLGTQTSSSSLSSDFLKLISRQDNEPVLQAVVCTFWDVGLAKKTYPKILQKLTHHLAKELGVMCVTSTLEAAIITLILVQVGVTRFALDAYAIPLGAVVEIVIEGLDALSYFALILTIGIISSFFNHEATMNRLVAGAVALEDHAGIFHVEPSKELLASAKNTVNNFNYSWSAAEFFIFLSVQLYTLILLLFAGAGLPLSCGITARMPGEQIHLYWLIFVVVFTAGHFLSTCVWPSSHGASEYRITGILLEALLLAILYVVPPPLFGSFLQILFAVMPASYLFWYLWMKIHYENSVQFAKPKEWKRQHRRNMGIYICLMTQLIVAIIVSIFSIYKMKKFVHALDVPDIMIDVIVEQHRFEQPWKQKYQCLCYWLNDKGDQASFKQSGQVKAKAKNIETISTRRDEGRPSPQLHACDIAAYAHARRTDTTWLIFVVIFTAGHFLSTCVWLSSHGTSEYRIIGILKEALLLAILYVVQPPLFVNFLQILFVVMPASYLFWYLWMKIHYEYSCNV